MNKSLRGLPCLYLILGLTFVLGCESRSTTSTAPETVSSGLVTMQIHVADKVEVFEFPDVRSGTTLESLMREMKQMPVVIRGSKTTAFVHSIGDQVTSASEGWTFRVDGEFANEGVGSTVLHPPTTISWQYGEFSESSQP